MDALHKAIADAATIVEQNSTSAAKSANTAVGGLVDQLGEVEVESAPTPAPAAADPGVASFGSPAPPSPLDGAAKLLDFESAKPVTPQPAQSPPTPTMAPLSAAPVAAAATQPLPVTPATPLPATASSAAAAVAAAASSSVAGSSGATTAEGPIDYASFVEDTLLWVNKVRSVVYLLGGLLAVYLVHRLLTSGVTLVTGVAWLLLAQAALNFVRGFINPKLQARCTWQDSALTSLLLQGVSNAVKGAAALHDRHLTSPDAGKLLRIVVVLWGVSLAGRLVGATGLAAALWVLAFSVPKVYLLNKKKVDTLASDAFAQAKGQFVKLDPKVRAAVVVLPTFIAGYLLSRADLSIAVLALALYGRSLMAQSQVDKVNAAVAPVSNTVVKVGDTVGNVLQNAVAKYELTPTPAKKKRE